ncbi:hypothetical protein GOBAR_DD17126 [Gossypium barbadense]|nr:hypothetical protein GOBAR_DD17126 [Gossypium barbadense]
MYSLTPAKFYPDPIQQTQTLAQLEVARLLETSRNPRVSGTICAAVKLGSSRTCTTTPPSHARIGTATSVPPGWPNTCKNTRK